MSGNLGVHSVGRKQTAWAGDFNTMEIWGLSLLIWRVSIVIATMLAAGAFISRGGEVGVVCTCILIVALIVLRSVLIFIRVRAWANAYPRRRDAFLQQIRSNPELAARSVGGHWEADVERH